MTTVMPWDAHLPAGTAPAAMTALGHRSLVAAWTAACETSGDHSETPLLVTTDQNLIQFRIL